jgi:hypothetical protein
MAEPSSERIVERLTLAVSAERAELAQQIVDHAFSQRLRDVVAPPELLPIVLAALTRENLARELERLVQPGVRRYSAVVADAPERLADLVPEDAVAALQKQLEQPTGARARWAKGAVDPALLKRLLGPVWVQLLVSFARRIPGLGGAASSSGSSASSAAVGGIAGMLGRTVQQSAGRIVGAGKSALEGLGIDVEKRLMAAARDFSDGALSVWNQALRERLQSPEGSAIVTQIKHGVLEHVLKARLSDIDRDAVALPLAPYLDLVPAIVGHAVRVPFVRKIIDSELQAYLAVAGDRRLDELLAELGVLDATRKWLISRVDAQLLGLCATSAFAGWIAKLVDAR